jgi:hypothetical protein
MLTLPVRIKKQAMTMIGKNDCTPISVLRREPLLMREYFLQSKMTTISESKVQLLLYTFLQGEPTATQALKSQNLELFVNSDATHQP